MIKSISEYQQKICFENWNLDILFLTFDLRFFRTTFLAISCNELISHFLTQTISLISSHSSITEYSSKTWSKTSGSTRNLNNWYFCQKIEIRLTRPSKMLLKQPKTHTVGCLKFRWCGSVWDFWNKCFKSSFKFIHFDFSILIKTWVFGRKADRKGRH